MQFIIDWQILTEQAKEREELDYSTSKDQRAVTWGHQIIDLGNQQTRFPTPQKKNQNWNIHNFHVKFMFYKDIRERSELT